MLRNHKSRWCKAEVHVLGCKKGTNYREHVEVVVANNEELHKERRETLCEEESGSDPQGSGQ